MHLMAILPQIHRLFVGGVTAGLSDGVLLRRYCESRDEHAFATLVARHGAMVLSVCRGVLWDESQVEDAFQAVFLVLVRRARSIRVDDSLGGWLHAVAYRVAQRANAQVAKRRVWERTGVAVDHAVASRPAAPDPRLAALHEEIARLPESYRQPLVLCSLEGKTQVEAAREIGCGEATVRRRLVGALERLRTRLNRRDVREIAPASLPAVPPRLVESAILAVGGPNNPLATAVLRQVARVQVARLVSGLVVFGWGAAGVVAVMMAQTAPPPSARPNTPAVAQERIVVQHEAVVAQPEVVAQDSAGDFAVTGRVIGPDGKPCFGATVFLRGYGIRVPERKTTTDVQGRFTFTTKRELGLKMTQTAPDKFVAGPYPDADEIKNIKPRIIAVAPGFGFGLLSPGEDVTIQLSPDEPVTGRVTDQAGKPVARARVRVRNVYWPKRDDDPLNVLDRAREVAGAVVPSPPKPGTLDPWLDAVKRAGDLDEYQRALQFLSALARSLGDIPAAHAPFVPPVTTDAEGRFKVTGIGRERVAELYVDGVPDEASSLIVVATRAIDTPIVIGGHAEAVKRFNSTPWEDLTVYGNHVELAMAPGRAVEGVVSDRTSGLPLKGVHVVGPWTTKLEYPGFDRFQTLTDGLGRYRIEGLPLSKGFRFTVKVPKDQPYLGREVGVAITPGTGPVQADFALGKGVWITGKVVDDATGEPIRDAIVEYHAFVANPFLSKDRNAGFAPEFDTDFRTNDDGAFRLRGYPGRGIVAANGWGYLEGVGAERIAGLKEEEYRETLYSPGGFSPYIRSAIIEVNVPEGAESSTCELRLKKGKSRQVLVVGPDGKPQRDIQASGLANQIENPMTNVNDDRFTVTNLFQGESREVVARAVTQKVIGMAVVTEKGDGPLTLQLHPWATLTGRFSDDQGKPRSRSMQIRLEDGKLPIHTFNGRNYDKEEFSIAPDGCFQIEGLVPGAKYRLQAIEGNTLLLGDLTEALTLQPGETRDLGDVKVLKSSANR